MYFFLLLFFGIAPALIWLLFYLREDAHPEPNWIIRKAFLWGMFVTIPAIPIEMALERYVFDPLPFSFASLAHDFLGIALVEELLKYAVVRWRIYSTSAIDEPLDIMLYMVIAGLGFAALENVLMLWSLDTFSDILTVAALRFTGATFLHALTSGIFGYFIALSLIQGRHKILLPLLGLGVATFLHGLFNFSILELQGLAKILGPTIILSTLALSVFFAFRHLRNTKSVCT